jgi:hypothetical protein
MNYHLLAILFSFSINSEIRLIVFACGEELYFVIFKEFFCLYFILILFKDLLFINSALTFIN